MIDPMTTQLQRKHELHRLHQSSCFVIPNPWDLGGARVLAQLGFPALATTSSGFAVRRVALEFDARAGVLLTEIDGQLNGDR